jgi:hypothetical protein
LLLLGLLAPLLAGLRRRKPIGRVAVPAGALAVFVAGAYWFVARLLG